jgi:putative ubiquitin-RnfH superfamily antitoxin RatB of RatAB toxin-antitoxin module
LNGCVAWIAEATSQRDHIRTEFEKRVAGAYRKLGAKKIERNVDLAGNQIGVYVEMEASARVLHRIAVEAKDLEHSVGINIVNDFAKVVDALRRERLIDEGCDRLKVGFQQEGACWC